MGELYTCKDVAERYGVQIITVWEWIRKKKLGAIKIGKEYRVSAEDIKAFDVGDSATLNGKLFDGAGIFVKFHRHILRTPV